LQAPDLKQDQLFYPTWFEVVCHIDFFSIPEFYQNIFKQALNSCQAANNFYRLQDISLK